MFLTTPLVHSTYCFTHFPDEPTVISLHHALVRHTCPVCSSNMLIPALVCEQQKKMQVVFWHILPQQMLVLSFVWFFLCMLYCKQHNQPLNVQLALWKESLLFHLSFSLNFVSDWAFRTQCKIWPQTLVSVKILNLEVNWQFCWGRNGAEQNGLCLAVMVMAVKCW